MKFGATLLIFATLVAIAYGVIFSRTYPLVEVSSGIATLCALLALATCLVFVALWRLLTKAKG